MNDYSKPRDIGQLEEKYRNRYYERTGEWPGMNELLEEEGFWEENDNLFGPPKLTRKDHYPSAGHITESEFRNAYEAVCHSNRHGIIPNVALTINWAKIGVVQDRDVEQRTRKFWQCFVKRDNTRAVAKAKGDLFKEPFPYISVFERNGAGELHTHALLAVAEEDWEAFKIWLENYLVSVNSGKALPEGMLSRKINKSVVSQWTWFRYIFKTLDPAVPWNKDLGLKTWPATFMRIKRVIVCRVDGRKKRKSNKFKAWPTDAVITFSKLWTSRHYDAYVSQKEAENSSMAEVIRSIDRFLPDE